MLTILLGLVFFLIILDQTMINGLGGGNQEWVLKPQLVIIHHLVKCLKTRGFLRNALLGHLKPRPKKLNYLGGIFKGGLDLFEGLE